MADTIINSANSTAATEREIILSIVQDELLDAAMLRPTVREFPANKGDKSVEIPKFSASFDGPAAINTDGATTQDFQDIAFSTDVITLTEHVALPYRITDRASLQSAVSVEAEAAKSAGQQMGIYMDDQIIARLQEASAAGPDHQIGLDGRAGQSEAGDNKITLEGITTARKKLNEQNLQRDEKWLVISTCQEKELLDLDNFRNADSYGAREALLNGEIGKVYGFRVMVHNRLADYESFAYTRDAVGIAVQREVELETDRADVRLAATDYAFRMLMGSVVLDGGKKVVWMLGAA